MSDPRRAALRSYFLAVARDLVARGAVRRQQGQTLDDILRTEFRSVMRVVTEDLQAIAVEMGQSLIGSVVGAFFSMR